MKKEKEKEREREREERRVGFEWPFWLLGFCFCSQIENASSVLCCCCCCLLLLLQPLLCCAVLFSAAPPALDFPFSFFLSFIISFSFSILCSISVKFHPQITLLNSSCSGLNQLYCYYHKSLIKNLEGFFFFSLKVVINCLYCKCRDNS